jgi:hypothetical protein
MNRTRTYDHRYAPCWDKRGEYVVGGEVVEGTPCAYCGEHSDHAEHLVPYSFLDERNTANSPQDGWWTWVLPSCPECNYIASTQVFASAHEKRTYIQQRLRAKYSVAFIQEGWSDEELDDLGPRLRQFVQSSQAANEIARERVEYSGPLPYELGSMALQDAVRRFCATLEEREAND